MSSQNSRSNMILIAPSIRALRTSRSFRLTVSSRLRCLIWVAAVRQKVFSCWARLFLTVVGGPHLGSSRDGQLVRFPRAGFLSCGAACTDKSKWSELLIVYSGKSSSSRLSSSPNVINCDNLSAACCSMPSRCTTSMLHLRSFWRHGVCRVVESVRSGMRLKAS